MAIIFLLLLSLFQPVLPAGAAFAGQTAPEYGKVIDARKTELAPGAVYTWMDLQNERGPQKIHTVEFNPANANLKLRAGTKSGKVYGMKAVTEMAAYADAPGSRVIAGINGDFYEISGFATGVPNGMFMDNGVILNSGSTYSFGVKADGSSLYGTPKLTKTVTIGGKTSNLTSINRYRNSDQLVLYTENYNTSTKSANDGDEVVLDVISGEVKSGQTLKLKVSEIRSNQGDTPLAPGTVVLSASGASRPLLAGLAPGDEVTASFALDGEWSEAALIIGGTGPLVKDGVVQTGVGPEGVHPRTAVGTKADGSIVLFEIDGRAPGFSEGVETEELAAILKDLGVVNAMNLDGGGSSTFVARMPGTNGVKMLNQGSDGYERKTGNGLLLVNAAPELNTASKLAVQPSAERILQGSSFTFTAAGMDANGHPAPIPGALNWQIDPGLGSIDEKGVFTAGTAAASGKISAAAGAVQGSSDIEVVDELTGLKFPDLIKTYTSGATAKLTVKALRNGQVIQADNHSFKWSVEGNIGTVDENGVFKATSENGQNGKIIVQYGTVEASFEVNVGLPPVVLEDFEAGIGKYAASSAKANSVAISEVTDQDYIRGGDKALKLEYDFVNTTGTSGAYAGASSIANRIQVPGYPEKIGMWIYGDGQKHWLRGQMRDADNKAFAVDFTDQVQGVDWKGWKYVEASVPKGKMTPLTMDLPVRYMETSNLNKTAGAIYVDDIRAVYGPLNEDMAPPVIKNEYPAAGEIVKTAAPTLSMNGEDEGYDPVAHPGTTLIDPGKTRLYVDDQLVEHGFYPPKGQITYKPKTALAEGRHKVKLAIRDMSGNQTIKEWYFMVNLGSPYYVYQAPDVLFAGGTYTLDIKAENADKLKEGHIEFAFDPAAVTDLQVIRGSKLSEEQINPVIDAGRGTVRLNLNRMNEARLDASDLIGQIRYTVRGDYVGPYTLEQTVNEVSKALVIENTSGSVISTEGSGQPISFIGAPVAASVKTSLKLNWNHYNIAKGYEAAFTVNEAESGAAVQGASLLINGTAAEAVSDGSGTLITGAATMTEGTFRVQAVKDGLYSPVMTFKVAPYDGTAAPRNVNVTMGADTATSRQFTWQTDPNTTDSVVELIKQAEFTGFEEGKGLRIEGSSYIYNTNNDGTMRVHKAEATGLAPGTKYVYRVGDGKGNASSQGTFTTDGGGRESTKFLFIGDSQADSKAGFGLWGTTLQKAFEYMPDAEMLVHAGDMVDKGFEQEQWNWWFEAAQPQLLNTTLVPIIGNHEVMGTNGDGDYLAQFNNPQNGADSVKGSNYSFDLQDTHFVVMNTEHGAAEMTEQAEWLDRDLTASDKKWTVVFFHQGPYGSIYSNERVQATWVPVFDKHKVDLVMNGHDHIYLRTFPMKDGKQVSDGQGTRYVIGGSSGPKFYALTERFWQEKIYDEDEQIFTAVEIKDRELTVVARTVAGAEIDRLVIAKAPPESVTLDRTAVDMEPGQSIQLQAEVHPDDASTKKVNWSVVSATPQNSVTVDTYGLVTAVQAGTAKVRATVDGYPAIYAESTITVDQLQSLALQGKGVLQAGQSDRTVTEAVYASGKRSFITEGLRYSSLNPAVASIDDQGTVQALSQGATVISVTYRDLTAHYDLTVTQGGEAVMTGIAIKGPDILRPGSSGTAVVHAVYSDSSTAELTEGVVYSTSNQTVAVIDESGEIHAMSEGTATIRAEYGAMGAEYVLKVTAGEPGPTTEPTPQPTTSPGPTASPAPTPEPTSPPSGGQPVGTAAPTAQATTAATPAASSAPGVVSLTAAQLTGSQNASSGIAITVDGELEELQLPGNAAELLGQASLTVNAANVSITIPSAVLAELRGKAGDGAFAGSKISLKATAVPGAAASSLLARAGSLAGAELQAVGVVREWSLSIVTEQGRSFGLGQFSQPVTIAYEVNANVDRSLLGLYYLSDDGRLEYAGGQWVDGKWAAAVSHFSKYAVLQYDKTFADLPASHWAVKAVKQLAAKQLVQGTSAGRYEPSRAITRAEFTAMLVRALGLSGKASSAFADVRADKWYAGPVGLAVQAGIATGQSAAKFAPDEAISRQEMAAMLVRAYGYAARSGAAADAQAAAFTDISQAPQWARQAIGEASALGLMQGRGQEQFAPQEQGTRAESAQMLLNLLDKLQK
ncbi:phosphodiester glycosidase family protein [Paenibacillus riograndensis]|uniref:phosphodiester glycosidase family protein n=1 Tax=Paenibacillus riograndensis TaxID=483937 RepID=UPI0014288D41|nr:phosphodiester glycosidase family protein [Paenibacillus riograndensis]